MNKMNKKGFTIVELVIVIAVIAILAGVLIPTFGGIIDRANESAALQEVKNAYTATMANEMATPDTNDDVITKAVKANGIVVLHDGIKIAIAKDGTASVADKNAEATYKVVDEEIVLITPAQN